MTELTPSAVLLAAADRVRDLAADTTHPRPNGHGWSLLADDGESDAWEPDWSTVLSCAGSGGEHPIAVDVRVGDARWIAALSPAIAPHLETWLRSTASRLEAWLPTGWPIREDEAAALRFALAILGKTAEEVDAAARQAEGSGVEAP